ncbi:flavin monoamine oxidase family protein [Ancylobacter defluvii]|uniref:Amine oxidase n=1 Tax=Ancylobacter defluvii TaxID=1282440 RepID=A0A9W6N9V3_9HYPH|nr:NAD(P)/FAD-dependent oxidoreductase [Ancylobacter defluvii]GLK82993.1 amine oxidase [Ancylobacter defluvii]
MSGSVPLVEAPMSSDPISTAGMSRRDALRAGAAGLLSAAIAGPTRAFATEGRRRILVLGAGMAGLTAALSLLRRGHEVTIIEAQNRIGGRLMSLPLGDGMFTEAGGGHFRSNMPYVLHYVRHFNLPLLGLNDGLPRYLVDGETGDGAHLAAWPWQLAPDERNVSVSTTLNRYLERVGLDADTALDARWPDLDIMARLDNVRLSDLIRGVGASDGFCKLLNAHAGPFTGDSPALGMVPRAAYHFGDKNLFRIQGGNDRLPMAMAEAVGLDRIVLGAAVAEIDQNGARVRVATRDGREFHGDAVISTIPFSVIGDVRVTPGWSSGKARLFAGMAWDKTVKVIVKTRTPSWLAHGVYGWPMAGGDRPWERVIDITGNEPGGHGSLFFYLNGPNAEAVMARPKPERARWVVDQFKADMPDLLDEVLFMDDFAWAEQPWIKASFGGTPLGGGWMIGECARPEGRIHFAGDFTTFKTGWVEGAIESGLRAARQIDPAATPEGNPRIRQEL